MAFTDRGRLVVSTLTEQGIMVGAALTNRGLGLLPSGGPVETPYSLTATTNITASMLHDVTISRTASSTITASATKQINKILWA